MAKTDSYDNSTVSFVHDEDISRAAGKYSELLHWLAKHHGMVFAAKESQNKNYVVAFWSPHEKEKEPERMYFARKKRALDFLRKSPEAVFEYRHSDQMGYLL